MTDTDDMLFRRFASRLEQVNEAAERVKPEMSDRQLLRALEDVEVLLDTARRDLSMDTIDLLRERYTEIAPDGTDVEKFVDKMVHEFTQKRGRRLPKASKIREALIHRQQSMGAVPRTR